ncbi:hypothetical protein CQW23_21856 [Capsicum baccatum]|uniref:Uncharacterized protein n=1 Tax=Capsicum baccatum TaxID=33114 RepID=A0A2G2VZB2_CAPBA|nr:hypothetical protein CQW23_21856 [Capsicum baccatum]
MREFTQKINVSGGMHHEQVVLKVDMDAIESFVKTYNDDANAGFTGDRKLDKKINVEPSQKFIFDDSAILTETIEVQYEQKVYDLILSLRHRKSSHEIYKLSVMLPTYLCDNEFLKNTERTVWSSLEAYTDKISQDIGAVNQNLFDVEYVEDIAQQVSESLVKKARKNYASDHDDPSRPRSIYVPPADDSTIVVIE